MRYPRLWVSRDGTDAASLMLHAKKPFKHKFSGGFLFSSENESQPDGDVFDHIGIKLKPGQCVEFELRPVAKKGTARK